MSDEERTSSPPLSPRGNNSPRQNNSRSRSNSPHNRRNISSRSPSPQQSSSSSSNIKVDRRAEFQKSADPSSLIAERIYVGNLRNNVRESELDEEFIKYGNITQILFRPEKPYMAFISYQDSASAKKAIQSLHNQQHDLAAAPRLLIVRYAESRPLPNNNDDRDRDRGDYRGRSRERERGGDRRPPDGKYRGGPFTRIYIGMIGRGVPMEKVEKAMLVSCFFTINKYIFIYI